MVGAFAAALKSKLDVVLVLSMEPDAACLRLGTLDFGTGSRDSGLGSLEATCGSRGGEESILAVRWNVRFLESIEVLESAGVESPLNIICGASGLQRTIG